MKLLDYIFAARPLLHVPAWTIFLVSLHYHNQLSGEHFSGRDLLLLAGVTLLIAGAMYVNQVFDAKSDEINGKVGFLQRGIFTERELMTAFLVCSVLGLAIAPFISSVTVIIFSQSWALSWLYSAPPLRLKDRAFWGLFTNAYTYGFLVSCAVMPELGMDNIGLLGWDNPFYFALVVGAIYCLTTTLDRVGDEAADKRTIAVILGPRGAKVVAFLLTVISVYVAYRSGYYGLAGLSGVTGVLLFLNILLANDVTAHVAIKAPIVLLILIAGYHYPFYLVFIIVLGWLTRLYYRRRFNIGYPSLT